jgi:hypothetical protein
MSGRPRNGLICRLAAGGISGPCVNGNSNMPMIDSAPFSTSGNLDELLAPGRSRLAPRTQTLEGPVRTSRLIKDITELKRVKFVMKAGLVVSK